MSSITTKPIGDLERNSILDTGGVTYMRIRASSVVDTLSISSNPMGDLRRRMFYDDGVNTHIRTINGSVNVDGGSPDGVYLPAQNIDGGSP